MVLCIHKYRYTCLMKVIYELGMTAMRVERIATTVQHVRPGMGVGARTREEEGFVPSPYNNIDLYPFEECWTPW